MPPRTLLVHVHDDDPAAQPLAVAAALAHAFDARLIGLHVAPGRDLGPAVASLIPPEIAAALLQGAADAQHAAEAAFRAAASRHGLRVDWRAPAGDPIAAALAHGRACDLVVLGQPDPDAASAGFAAELLASSLLGLGRPILAVPYAGRAATLGERVLIALDGGREAARAIGDAMPFLERASAVTLLAGGRALDEVPSPFAHAGARVVEWLRDHGVAASVERYEWDAGGKGEWLLSRAADLRSDLIVMGGFGHSRLREIALGGMTRTILSEMTVPVLLSH